MKTFVSIDEAFRHGVTEGLRGALLDVQKMLKEHPEFLEKYLEIRLQHLQMVEDFIRSNNG